MLLSTRFGTPEQEDVTFWTVDHVMLPSDTLLNSQVTPFCFGHESILRNILRYVFGNVNMPGIEDQSRSAGATPTCIRNCHLRTCQSNKTRLRSF